MNTTKYNITLPWKKNRIKIQGPVRYRYRKSVTFRYALLHRYVISGIRYSEFKGNVSIIRKTTPNEVKFTCLFLKSKNIKNLVRVENVGNSVKRHLRRTVTVEFHSRWDTPRPSRPDDVLTSNVVFEGAKKEPPHVT